MLSQCLLNRIQFVLCEAKVFPNGDRPIRAIQFKDGLVPVSDYLDARRPMVIRINDNAKTKEAAGQLANYIKPKRLGYYGQSSNCLGRTRKFVGRLHHRAEYRQAGSYSLINASSNYVLCGIFPIGGQPLRTRFLLTAGRFRPEPSHLL